MVVWMVLLSSDKLGLDSIYIQAKKWKAEHKIGRPELQSFAGACLNTSKLIFITTSSFTEQAIPMLQQ